MALDSYVAGVVPREMPASWSAAAVQAQAIAARSYARNSVESHAGSAYDICDTDQCQVYGGMRHLGSSGQVLWTDDPAATSGNSNDVLRYNNATIFAQFSASDGGWTVSGGQPYLPAERDPYDNAKTGDPYLNWNRTPSVASIASHYGLRSVSAIGVTQRDGNGDWGGRVLSGYVDGVTTSGQSTRINATGFDLQSALGLPHNWFTLQAVSSLGGTVVHSTTTSATVFFNAGGVLTMRSYDTDSGWHTPVDLGAPAHGLSWDPDAASWGDGHIDVFARDGAGGLVNRSYSPGSGWTGWRSNGVSISSSPGAVDPVPGEGDVFWLAANHTLQTIRWTQAAGWTGPVTVPGVTNAASGPDATTLVTSKNIVVVYQGTDGRFWTVTRTGTGSWQAPVAFNAAHALPVSPWPHVDPSVTNSGAEVPNVFYTGTNGVVYHSSDDPATKTTSAWYAVPGAGTTSAPDAWNDLPSHGDVVSSHGPAFGTASWSSTTGWRSWQPIE